MFSIQGDEDLEDCIRFSGHPSRRYASHSDASSTHPLGRGSPAAFLLGKRTIALESAMSVKRAMLMETTRIPLAKSPGRAEAGWLAAGRPMAEGMSLLAFG